MEVISAEIMAVFFDKSQSLSFKEACAISWGDIMNKNGSGFEDGSLIDKYLDERHHHTQISFFLCLKISKNSAWCGCNIIQWLDSKDIYRERIVYVKINFEGPLNFTWDRVNMVWVSFHLSRSSLQ